MLRSPLLLALLVIGPALPALAQSALDDLPDFSRAGYREGQVPPRRPATLDVRAFGARGDGRTDDTAAFRAALAEAARTRGVVRVPPGRWVVSDVLEIQSDGVVLQGAGSDRTVLVCPRALADMRGVSKSWSWSGGLLWLTPRGETERLAEVGPGEGQRELSARWERGPQRPAPGEWLELQWFNDAGQDTLLDHLYGGVIPKSRMGAELQAATSARVVEWVQVLRVDGETLTVAREPSLPLRPEWRPALVRRAHLRDVGVEGVSVEFPLTEYPGHLRERGYNAIHLQGGIDCWIRDVTITNADSGVFVNRSRRVTVSDVVIRGRQLHHCLSTSWSSHNLFTRWRIEAPHRHGTTISWGAHRNVFSRGWGWRLAMDSHRAASFENLHTAITIDWDGRVQSPFRSGGSRPRGPHAARGNVYWNVRYRGPDAEFHRVWGHGEWPRGVFVGWRGNRPLRFQPTPGLEQRILLLNRAPPVLDLHGHQVGGRPELH